LTFLLYISKKGLETISRKFFRVSALGLIEKIEMQKFPNFRFFKNTRCSKFSQNFNFYFTDLFSKKIKITNNYNKQLKASPKNLAEIGKPMVLTSGELTNIDPYLHFKF
jgi:hypothetical protein